MKLSVDSRHWLTNPVWFALQTEHSGLSVGAGQARRYPSAFIPFAGLASREQSAFDELHGLLEVGESLYITGETALAAPAGFTVVEEIAGLQMIFTGRPAQWPGDLAGVVMEKLDQRDVPEMLALKKAAFPGFYGPRAPELGTYFGIRVGGELVAMAGERLALPGMREVSAVCTHPLHTGRGYAAWLIARLVDGHLQAGLVPFLHLVATNVRALALYERLGFVQSRALLFQEIRRV